MGRAISSTHVATLPPRDGDSPLHFDDGVAARTAGMESQRAGRPQAAQVLFERAEELFSKAGDAIQLAWTWQNQGQVLEQLGRIDDALEAYGKAEAAFAQFKQIDGSDLIFRRRGDLLRRLGKHQEATEQYTEALRRYDARRDPNGCINTRSSLAANLLAVGDHAGALNVLHTALANLQSFNRKPGEQDYLLFIRLSVAERAAGHAAVADQYFAEAQAIADSAHLRTDQTNPDVIAAIQGT